MVKQHIRKGLDKTAVSVVNTISLGLPDRHEIDTFLSEPVATTKHNWTPEQVLNAGIVTVGGAIAVGATVADLFTNNEFATDMAQITGLAGIAVGGIMAVLETATRSRR